tara:strand:+ start:1943 stop:2146 length:204 start_codon:yes stop_codon:yes gene_type:complete
MRGSCDRCEEREGVIIDDTNLYCSTCYIIEHQPCESCGDRLGRDKLVPMLKDIYTKDKGYYCDRCID